MLFHHGPNRFSGGFLFLKRGFELNYDIFAVWSERLNGYICQPNYIYETPSNPENPTIITSQINTSPTVAPQAE
jgi:hypothetical protein